MPRTLAVLVAAAALLTAACTGATPPPAPPPAVPGGRTGPDLATLTEALNSSDPSRQAQALPPELRASTAGRPLLPPGTTVTIDPATLRGGAAGATVEADVAGQGRTRLLLVPGADGHWYVAYTEAVA